MSHLTARTISSPTDLAAVIRDLELAVQAGPVTLATIRGAEFTPAEAGVVLGVSRQFVDRLIAQGRLACERLPGSKHRRIPAVEVFRFADAREQHRIDHARAVKTLDAGRVPWE